MARTNPLLGSWTAKKKRSRNWFQEKRYLYLWVWSFKTHHSLSPVCEFFDPRLNHLWPVCSLVMGTILPHSTTSNQSLGPTFLKSSDFPSWTDPNEEHCRNRHESQFDFTLQNQQPLLQLLWRRLSMRMTAWFTQTGAIFMVCHVLGIVYSRWG